MLIPKKTHGEGNCAFHAIFGIWTGEEFFCTTAQEERQQLANAIGQATSGAELRSRIINAIQALIMDLEGQQGLKTNQEYLLEIARIYGQSIVGLFSDYQKNVAFDWQQLLLTSGLLQDYARFLEQPSQHLMEAELALIAEVFGRNRQPSTCSSLMRLKNSFKITKNLIAYMP